MWFTVLWVLLAILLTSLMMYGFIQRKYVFKMKQLDVMMRDQAHQLESIAKEKQVLSQRVADLEYQLRESKKDVTALEHRLENKG